MDNILILPETEEPPKDERTAARRAVTWLSTKARNQCCTKRMLHRRLPITKWLPRYTLEDCVADLVAGLTVTLTVLPQAIAYAGIAGLPPEVCTLAIHGFSDFMLPIRFN